MKYRQRIAGGVLAAVMTTGSLLAVAPVATASDVAAVAGQAAGVIERATGTGDLAPSVSLQDSAATATTDTGSGNVTVEVPKTASGDVRVTGPDGSTLAVSLPETKDVTGHKAGAGTVVYPSAANSTDIAVQPTTDGGARALVTLKNSSAPTQHRFTLDLPAGSELTPNDEAGYDIVKGSGHGGKFVLGKIDAPWAKDAQGRDVPTSYKLEGTTLVQEVTTDKNTAYPVVADPKWTWGIVSGTVYFNKQETRHMAGNASFVAAAFAFAPPPFNVYGVLNAANIARVGSNSASDGKCVKVKVPTFWPDSYTGGYCK